MAALAHPITSPALSSPDLTIHNAPENLRHHLGMAFSLLSNFRHKPVYVIRLEEARFERVQRLVTDFIGQPAIIVRHSEALYEVPTAARFIHVSKEYQAVSVCIYRADHLGGPSPRAVAT